MNATNEYRAETKKFREFKNQYAKAKEIDGVNTWAEYLDWCDSNAYDRHEIDSRYDDLVFEYIKSNQASSESCGCGGNDVIKDSKIDRARAIKWWDSLPMFNLDSPCKRIFSNKYYTREPQGLTGREIETIWRKEVIEQ